MYRSADKSLARPGRKQSTATDDFDVHISYFEVRHPRCLSNKSNYKVYVYIVKHNYILGGNLFHHHHPIALQPFQFGLGFPYN